MPFPELSAAHRRLRRSPGFVLLAVITLGIGVGVNGAMFALLDGVLFRPPANIREPARVVRLSFVAPDGGDVSRSTDYPTFETVRDSRAFADIAGWVTSNVSIGRGTNADIARAAIVSPNFFTLLGTRAFAGHLFDTASATDAESVVLSYGYWQRHFGGTPVVGSNIRVDGKTYTVSGILPNEFISLDPQQVDLWLPLDHSGLVTALPTDWRTNRGSYWLGVLGRLKIGGTAIAAETQASAALHHQHLAGDPSRTPDAIRAGSLIPGRSDTKPREAKVSLWLVGVSSFVLLIACANIADLVLVRNLSRRKDYLIRVAVGASPGRIAKHLLADVTLLVSLSMVGAFFLSWMIRGVVKGFLSDQIPFSSQIVDARGVMFLVLSSLLAFLFVAFASLAHARISGLAGGTGSPRAETSAIGRKTRRGFLVAQAALTVALLFVAQLFAKSLERVQSLDLGLAPDQTIQVRLQVNGSGRSAAEVRTIYENALSALRADPAIAAATIAEGSPYQSGSGAGPWTSEHGREELWTNREVAYQSGVGDRFFTTVGATSLRGRDFSSADRKGNAPVAIVNEPLARYLWPGRSALGECMMLDRDKPCVRVVGVLGGVWKFSILERNKMVFYTPLAQADDAMPGTLFVQPRGDARNSLSRVRSIVQGANPSLPAVRVSLVRDIVDPEMRPWRFGAEIFSAFSVIALLIAAVGLHGVVSLGATMRSKEIGIRMALGAPRRDVLRVVVGEGFADIAFGLVAGALLVFAASRWLNGVLFQTSPKDGVVLAQTVLVLGIVAAAAVVMPTIKALRTNIAGILQSP